MTWIEWVIVISFFGYLWIVERKIRKKNQDGE